MANPTESKRRTADQIFFAEREKLQQKIKGLRRMEKLLAMLEKLSTDIRTQRDLLENLDMKRTEIIEALQPSDAAKKILRSNSKTESDGMDGVDGNNFNTDEYSPESNTAEQDFSPERSSENF